MSATKAFKVAYVVGPKTRAATLPCSSTSTVVGTAAVAQAPPKARNTSSLLSDLKLGHEISTRRSNA